MYKNALHTTSKSVYALKCIFGWELDKVGRVTVVTRSAILG